MPLPHVTVQTDTSVHSAHCPSTGIGGNVADKNIHIGKNKKWDLTILKTATKETIIYVEEDVLIQTRY